MLLRMNRINRLVFVFGVHFCYTLEMNFYLTLRRISGLEELKEFTKYFMILQAYKFSFL
jgi:hypothetical protein